MDDLISRQAAIDAILRITNCKSVRELFEYNQEHHLTEMWSGGVNDAIDAVIGVESATDNNVGTKLGTNLAEVGTEERITKGFPIDADLLMMKVDEQYGDRTRDRLYDIIRKMPKYELPPIQPKRGRWHYSDGKPARIGLSFGVVCDQCGTESEYCTNFCGECGADMREVTT